MFPVTLSRGSADRFSRTEFSMPRSLPLLAAALVIVVGATWFLNRGGDDAPAVTASGSAERVESDPQETSDVLEAPDDADVAQADPEDLSAPDPDLAAQELARYEASFGSGWWLDGTLELPDGAPVEELAIIAVPSKSRLTTELLAEKIASSTDGFSHFPVRDGEFRVHRKDAERIYLVLDSPWLYLEESVWVTNEPSVELKPKLGAALEVTGLRPSGAAPGDRITGLVVHAEGSEIGKSGLFSIGGKVERTAVFDSTGVARFTQLPADRVWKLTVDPEAWAEYSGGDIELRPGETARIDISFQLGASVAGQLTDELGTPVPGAEIAWRATRSLLPDRNPDEPLLTDAEGRYRLRGLRPGTGVVTAASDKHLPAQSSEMKLVVGDVRDDVDIVISSGSSISGHVRLANGEPAVGAIVWAEDPEEVDPWIGNVRDDRSTHTSVADDGSFRITGLVKADYNVYAELDRTGAPSWYDEREAVEAGTTGIELITSPPPGLTVRVVGPGGLEVLDATVDAWPWRETRIRRRSSFDADDDESSSKLRADSPDEFGAYLLAGAWKGRWIVRAKANGLVQEVDPLEFVVRNANDPLVIRMLAGASIAGVVLDPNGDPVKHVGVHVRDSAETRGTPSELELGGSRVLCSPAKTVASSSVLWPRAATS
jgi:Carboxypeptidase regulatory-like domain